MTDVTILHIILIIFNTGLVAVFLCNSKYLAYSSEARNRTNQKGVKSYVDQCPPGADHIDMAGFGRAAQPISK